MYNLVSCAVHLFQVATLRAELRARDTDLARVIHEKQKAVEGWQVGLKLVHVWLISKIATPILGS